MTNPTTPDSTSNAREAARAAVAAVNVALPATVVAYDHTTQTATVKLVPCFRRKNPANGNAVECYSPPNVPRVPVAFQGSGDYSDTYPLAVGSSGLLVVADRSLDEWRSTGAARTEPQDLRRHNLTDGVFLPGVRSPAAPLTGTALAADGRVLKAPKVVLESSDVRLGSAAATQAVALAPLVQANSTALEAALATAAAAAISAGIPADGGTAAFAAFAASLVSTLSAWPASVAATKVVAQ